MSDKSTYVFFRLLNEVFALDVKNVIETIEITELTPVPETPDFMKGVFIFRGNVLPVIDLRMKFQLPEADEDSKKYIIISTYESDDKQQNIGFIVDKIIDVVGLSEMDINDFPEVGSKYNTEFINGIVKHNDIITIVLNIEKILSSVEVDIINKSSSNFNLLKENEGEDENNEEN